VSNYVIVFTCISLTPSRWKTPICCLIYYPMSFRFPQLCPRLSSHRWCFRVWSHCSRSRNRHKTC
jgi:hypothetical protein